MVHRVVTVTMVVMSIPFVAVPQLVEPEGDFHRKPVHAVELEEAVCFSAKEQQKTVSGP